MAKTGRTSVAKRPASKAKSGRQTKSKAISKAKPAKSAKSTTVPATPALKKSASPKIKWAAPYEKKIRMFKGQGDYFALNQKYAGM